MDLLVQFEDRKYCKEHFGCSNCTKIFDANDKIFKNGNNLICENCSIANQSCKTCYSCKARLNETYMTAGPNNFHFQCFVCSVIKI